MRARPLILVVTLLSTACFGRGGPGLFFALAETALITAAVVSATQPPPPRVVYMPEPRPGYAWQPGYWTLQNDRWLWVDGGWIALQPGNTWVPTHWEQLADGNWELVPGHWAPLGPPPP